MIPATLRILMIGNSFSVCVCRDLPPMVAATKDCEIVLTSAYIGGCSLERHWNNVVESTENPEAKQYRVRTLKTRNGEVEEETPRNASVNELLQQGPWDIITIQQASHFSWNPETYQPFADNLIAFIQKESPESRIWIQQTWSYRADDRRLFPGSEWGFDQTGMFERARDAYAALSKHTGFSVIPTGEAVQAYRAQEKNPFRVATDEEKALLRWPDLPHTQSGDVVGRYSYGKNAETGKLEIRADTIHLNRRGEYLQACVWFQTLFGNAAAEPPYFPGDMDSDDAKTLWKCALKATQK